MGKLAALLASPPLPPLSFSRSLFSYQKSHGVEFVSCSAVTVLPLFSIKNSVINPERSDGRGQGRFSAAKEKQGGTWQGSEILPTPCQHLPQTLLTNNIMKIDICRLVMLGAILNVLCLGRNV